LAKGGKSGGFLSGYFEQTRRPIYSIVASAPFFIAYELGIAFLYEHQPEGQRVKNLAEVILHLPASRVGRAAAYLIPVVAGMILLYVLHLRDVRERAAAGGSAKSGGDSRLRTGFFIAMLAEGIVLALPLALLAREIPAFLNIGGTPLGQKLFRLTTMCGAGAYEELLFRLFMFTAFLYLGKEVLGLEKMPAGILAAVVSGVLFAAFHFVDGGVPRGLGFFVFASIAGIYLAGICHFRSFGMAVVTHAVYDIFLVLVGG
jgi:hypothetical protein